MNGIAATSYALICAGVILFQVCLIAGAPWGRLTQGGLHEAALPLGGRIVAAFSILLLLAMGGSILSAGGHGLDWPRWTGWVTLSIQGLSVIMNGLTPSRAERRIWTPVTLCMLGLAAFVMLASLAAT
jgi:hypothetical protein